MDKYYKIIILVLLTFLSINLIYSTACIGIGGGGYKLTAVKDKPTFFSFTIYNNDADPKTTCDPGIYSLNLNVKNQDIAKIFKYELSENNFLLTDSQTKQVMIKLIPLKSDGNYVIEIQAKMSFPENKNGTTISPTTSSQLVISIGDEITDKFANAPEWYSLEQKNKLIFIMVFVFIILTIIIIALIFYLKYKKNHHYY